MARQMPMRSYTNQKESGTMTKGGFRKDPLDNVIDRCLLLGQRLVAAESAIKNQATEIVTLKEAVKSLTEKLDEATAPSIVKEARSSKPRPARRRASKAKTTTTETTETETTT